MAPRIAILVCGHTIPPLIRRRGDFPDWFRAGLGLDEERAPAIDLPADDPLPDVGDFDAVVLTGSPAMVTEEEEWSLVAEAWVAKAHAEGLPLLGVCYGHQLLARDLGGEAGWNPKGREIGSVELELTPEAAADPLFEGFAPPLVAQATHSQSVTRLPADAVLLARNAHDPHQAFRVGARTWGVQFHPEFDADIVRGYLEHRAADLRGEGLDPERLAAAVRDDRRGTTLLRRFRELAGG